MHYDVIRYCSDTPWLNVSEAGEVDLVNNIKVEYRREYWFYIKIIWLRSENPIVYIMERINHLGNNHWKIY